MRAIWKGHIRFSLVTIPVRVYNAVDSAQSISFNQLHRDCNGRIGYDKRCKKCNEVVASDAILKGYQYEPEQYVILEPADFEKVKLQSTKVIEIEGFVKSSEVHPTLYEAPYFAGPESPVAAKAYALLCEALAESGRVAVGRVVLRDREDVVILSPQDGGLVLYKLRYPHEVRKMAEVPQLDDRQKTNPEELKLARHLLETMSTSLAEIEFKDRYNDALRELIEAKVQGKEIVATEPVERPTVDIMTALRESIEAAKAERQPMVKATGKGKKAASAADAAVPASKSKPSKARKRA